MKLDVVIPAFRDERVLETIASLEACELSNIELRIIVQVGNSGDEFVKLVTDRFSDVEVGIESDTGIFDAINIGLKKCRGDLVLSLGSDDRVFDKNCFQLVRQKFLTGAVCVLTDLQYTDDNWKPVRFWPARRINHLSYYLGFQHAHFSLFLSPKIFYDIGYFNSLNSVNADYEFFWYLTKYLKEKNIRSEIIPIVCIQMKHGGNSSSSLHKVFAHQLRLIRFAVKSAPQLLPAIMIFKWYHKLNQIVMGRVK